MHIDRTVGFADWPQTEVVGPADQHPIEPVHDCLRILPDFVTPGFVADRSTDALHSFLRGYRAEIDSALLISSSNTARTGIPENQTSLGADNPNHVECCLKITGISVYPHFALSEP